MSWKFRCAGLVALAMAAAWPVAHAAELETLLGLTFDLEKQEVTISVVSTGCTQKSHFTFDMKGEELSISRKMRDECKAMPGKVTFSYPLKEAGIDPNKPIKIMNKFIVNVDLANLR